MKKLICCLFLGLALVLPAVSPAWSALIGSGTVTLEGTESLTHLGRMNRNGVASTWAAPKPFPGIINLTALYYFKTVSFTPGSLENVEISYEYTSGPGTLFVAAYLNSFDVNNLSTNYLGDPGASPVQTLPGPLTFQVVVPAGDSLVLAFNTAFDGGNSVPGTVSYTVTGYPSTVPLPSAILLLGPGLVGLAAIRRRLKK